MNGQSEMPGSVVCRCCGLTESLETAKELWASTYVDGRLVGWTCGDCWHEDVEVNQRSRSVPDA